MARHIDPLVAGGRARREALGLTQADVAARVEGWDAQQVGRIETGRAQPLIGTLRRYLAAIGLEPVTREVE